MLSHIFEVRGIDGPIVLATLTLEVPNILRGESDAVNPWFEAVKVAALEISAELWLRLYHVLVPVPEDQVHVWVASRYLGEEVQAVVEVLPVMAGSLLAMKVMRTFQSHS